jgi:hypothetical protein
VQLPKTLGELLKQPLFTTIIYMAFKVLKVGKENWLCWPFVVKVSRRSQGCQVVHLYTKSANVGILLVGLGVENFGIFWKALEWKILNGLLVISWSYCIFYGN